MRLAALAFLAATAAAVFLTYPELLKWNGALPNVRVEDTTPEGNATQTFSVVADYGWAERVLCADSYWLDAKAICLAIQEALR